MKREALVCLSFLLALAIVLDASAFRGGGVRGGGGGFRGGGGGVYRGGAVLVLSADREAAARFGDRWVEALQWARAGVRQYADQWVAVLP